MRAKTINEKFKRGQDPIKSMGLGYGKKRESVAWKILEFIRSKGEEGASFTEIQKFTWLLKNPDRSEEDFYEKNPATRWNPKPQRKTRGYWTTNFGAYHGFGARRGLLDYYCKKNEKGKWVIDRWPEPGENLIAEAMDFERGLDPKRAMDIGMTPKRLVKNFTARLNQLGIEARYEKSPGYDSEIYDITINVINWKDEEETYFVSYASDKDAQAEWGEEDEETKGGFMLSDNTGEYLMDPTHDSDKVLKKLLTIQYGTSPRIQKTIIQLKKKIDLLTKINEIL